MIDHQIGGYGSSIDPRHKTVGFGTQQELISRCVWVSPCVSPGTIYTPLSRGGVWRMCDPMTGHIWPFFPWWSSILTMDMFKTSRSPKEWTSLPVNDHFFFCVIFVRCKHSPRRIPASESAKIVNSPWQQLVAWWQASGMYWPYQQYQHPEPTSSMWCIAASFPVLPLHGEICAHSQWCPPVSDLRF